MRFEPSPQRDLYLERELDRLLAAYREACPDVEAAPDFMPRLWQKIEARRTNSYAFGVWTKAFVTAAAVLCLVLGLWQTSVPSQPSFYTQTYIEALQAEAGSDTPSLLETLWSEEGGASYQ